MLVDPTDIEHPVALNLFDQTLRTQTKLSAVDDERLLQSTIELYRYIFSALLGAELTQKQGVVFHYLARAMLVLDRPTVHTLRAFIEDPTPYRDAMEKLDGTARSFFDTQFFTNTYGETRKQILTRLWGILAIPTFERMFSAPSNQIDLFRSLNDGSIVVINTAKELLKTEGAALLGRFFIALLTQATLARSVLPESQRMPTFVYIDEAHDYFDDKLGELMNQARKYRVGVTLAHQHLDQLSVELRSTLLASTSIKLVGGVNSKDAMLFAREMNTSADFIQARKKSERATEFACFVRHHTDAALPLVIPFGTLERQAKLDAASHQRVLEMNRVKVSARLPEGEAWGSAESVTPAHVDIAASSVTRQRQPHHPQPPSEGCW